MKKAFSLLLLIILLFSFARADTYSGCWAIWVPKSVTYNGNLCIILVLNEGGTMACLYTLDNVEEKTVELDNVTGTWESFPNGVTLNAQNESDPVHLDYSDGFLWFSISGMRLGLKKIDNYSIGQIQLVTE